MGYLRTISAKYQYNLVSGFRVDFFLSFPYRHIRELAPPPGGHDFLDIIMNVRNLQEGYLKTIPAKYQYNMASGFRGDF